MGFLQKPHLCSLGVELAAGRSGVLSRDPAVPQRPRPGAGALPPQAGACPRCRASTECPERGLPSPRLGFSTPWRLCHPPLIWAGTAAGRTPETSEVTLLALHVHAWAAPHSLPLALILRSGPWALQVMGHQSSTDGWWLTRARSHLPCPPLWPRAREGPVGLGRGGE